MKLKTLQFTSRFSLPPNSLGYCGKDTAPEKFKSCVIDGDCESVEKEIENFIVLNPYLKTISEVINETKFSYEVSEAYWIGNDKLKKFKNKDYSTLLRNFAEQGVPEWLINDLDKDKPKNFIPTHLFQVLHVGVGRASGAVPYNIKTINNCMIRWGKVKEINKDNFKVSLNSLEDKKKKYQLKKMEEMVRAIPGFVPNLSIGDFVAVHWKQIIKKLTNEEVEKLSFWTKKVLRSL